MPYTKNTWAAGDVITSAKLNNMENGIESAAPSVIYITMHYDETILLNVLNKTYSEIKNYFDNGCLIFVRETELNLNSGIFYIVSAGEGTDQGGTYYYVNLKGLGGYETPKEYTCDTVNDYPMGEPDK